METIAQSMETRHRPEPDEEVHGREPEKGSKRESQSASGALLDHLRHEILERKTLSKPALRATTHTRESPSPTQNAYRSPREAGHVQQAL
jgi:hypothetical protein